MQYLFIYYSLNHRPLPTLGVGLGAKEFIAAATLISTAHILSKILPRDRISTEHPNVLFILFNGESYDYIGSQRFVYDLHREAFPSSNSKRNPIGAENVQLLIDIGDLNDLSHVNVYHNQDFDQVFFLLLLFFLCLT